MHALALLPALVLAAAPARTALLLVPTDAPAEATVPQLTAFMERALERFPELALRTNEKLFSAPPPPEQLAALKRAEVLFQDAMVAFESRQLDEAATKLRVVLQEFPKVVAVMPACGHYCDAIALFASTLQRQADGQLALVMLRDLMSLKPTYDLSPKRFDRDLIALRARVATSRGASIRGNVEITSKPAGAKVFIDGDPVGETPLNAGSLALGKHLLRIERVGYFVHGEVLEISSDNPEVRVTLRPTPEFALFEAQSRKLAGDLRSDKLGPSVISVGRLLDLERAVFGVVSTSSSGATDVQLSLVDFRAGKRTASQRTSFQGDEYGQLPSEAARAIRQLLGSDGMKAKRSTDPLEDRSGTEDWTREGERKKSKKSGDPLDGVSGTEDW